MSTKVDVTNGKSINNYCNGGNVQVAMDMMGMGVPDEHDTVELERNYPYMERSYNTRNKTKA